MPKISRQFEGIPAHQGKCTEKEVRSLQKCNMDGTKPYANLIVAAYAVQDDGTGDWALTDLGFEKVREWTSVNPTKYLV